MRDALTGPLLKRRVLFERLLCQGSFEERFSDIALLECVEPITAAGAAQLSRLFFLSLVVGGFVGLWFARHPVIL